MSKNMNVLVQYANRNKKIVLEGSTPRLEDLLKQVRERFACSSPALEIFDGSVNEWVDLDCELDLYEGAKMRLLTPSSHGT